MESRKRILSSKLLITGATGLLALLVVCVAFVLAPQATLAQPPDRPASAESAYAALAPALDLGNDPLTNTLCMGDVYDLYGGGGSPNCTANDVNLAQASVDIIEPCDFPGDTATISLTVLVNLTAQERHDIGAYLSIEGGNALTGTCNIYTLPYDPDPPWLDLDGTGDDGTFCGGDPNGQPCVSDDQCTAPDTCDDVGPGIQDTCGDIDDLHNPLILDAGVITVQCLDPDNDGWLDLPTCTSWRQPGANDLCTQPLNAFPGAPSKCRCEPIQLDVPVPPALYVDKVTDPSGDDTLFDFEVTGPTTDSFSLTDQDPPHLVAQPVSGTYSVTETVPAAWELISATCTDGSPVDAIELSNGEIVTCTFTNKLMQGTLEVIKELDPIDDPGVFDLWIDSTKVYTDASHLDSSGPQTVISGTYTVSESAGTNTSLADYDTSYTCTGGSAPSGDGTSFSVDVAAGEAVVCTFTNTLRTGTIVVEKQTAPPGGSGFGFTDDIEAPYSFTLDDGATETFSNVVAGTYAVTETGVPEGWDLTAYSCTDGSDPGAIDLDAGETVTCTFTNTQRGSIVIEKVTDPSPDPTNQSFGFTADPPLTPGTFSLLDGENQPFTNLEPGTYSVTETVPNNWKLASATCSDESDPTAIDLQAGETVTCTFSNEEDYPPIIEVTKTADPLWRYEPGGVFTFTVVVSNTSVLDLVTIDTMTDTIYGDITTVHDDILSTNCLELGPVDIGVDDPPYQCSFTANFYGQPDDTQIDIVTASGLGEDGDPVSDSDDATVTIVGLPSSILVTKTADPTTVSECGEPVTYTVTVENTSPADLVYITSMTDTIYGDITLVQGDILTTTCLSTTPLPLNVGDPPYECTFTANVSGNPGASLTDVVTASGYDDDGYPVSDFDDATVDFTDVSPSITVTKAAFPVMRSEPGGTFEYTVHVTNNSCEPVTLTSLTDAVDDPDGPYTVDITQVTPPDENGNQAVASTTCSLVTIEGYDSYDCTFTRYRLADPVVIDDEVTADAEDDEVPANTTSASDDAWIEITGRLDIEVSKTANPTTIDVGDTVTYTVVVVHTTLPAPALGLTLDKLVDVVWIGDELQYFEELDVASICDKSDLTDYGDSLECTFTRTLEEPGVWTDTVYAHVIDAPGTTGHEEDSATVNVIPIGLEPSVYLPLVMKNW